MQTLFLGAGTCVHVILTTGQDAHGEAPTVRDMREKGTEGGRRAVLEVKVQRLPKCLSHLLVVGIGIVQHSSYFGTCSNFSPTSFSLQNHAAVSRLSV